MIYPLPTNRLYDPRTHDIGGVVTVTPSPSIGDTSGVKKAYNARTRVTVTHVPKVLGIPDWREPQRWAINAATAGRDVLVVAPTGSGKTEPFLGAGLILGGVTLIVSPLRSLIADMHRRLERLELPVRIWNSDVKDTYKDETLRLVDGGWQGFVITTPESLKGRELSTALQGRVKLAVVDEAHCCLRERGFRVSYAWLGRTLDRIEPAQRYACTATLPAEDRTALVKVLHLDDPAVISLPVSRSNLSIRIVDRSPWKLTEILNAHRGQAGIVFTATVRLAAKLHAEMTSQGRHVALYHGRLGAKAKKAAQAAFMSGETPVAIATDAFLLGIDKADLRFIVHYDHPKSVEDWCQGFGRAGRDGGPAAVYGCFRGSSEGRASRQFLLAATYPPMTDLRAIWEYLIQAPHRDQTQHEIGETVLGRNGKYSIGTILSTLERFHLAAADPHPSDKRRRLYRGRGDFEAVDWGPYLREGRLARKRFEEFCRLVTLPDDQIPAAIDAYFDHQLEGGEVAA